MNSFRFAGLFFLWVGTVATFASEPAHADLRLKCNTTAPGQGSIFLGVPSDVSSISYQMADTSGLNQVWSGKLTCQGPNEAAYSCGGEIERGILFQTAQISLTIGEATLEGASGEITDNTQKIQYSCARAPDHVLKGADATEMLNLIGNPLASDVSCVSQNGVNTCFVGNNQINDPKKDSEIWTLLHHAGFLDTPNHGPSGGPIGQPTIDGGAVNCVRGICTFSSEIHG